MPWLQLKYTQFTIPPSPPFPAGQMILRPLLTVRLTGANDNTFSCIAWIDTGADHCVFPLSFALALGLNTLGMKRQNTGGVGSSANLTFYENITIDFGTGAFPCYAGFTQGLEAQGLGLLGQYGFLDRFDVVFSHKSGIFQIEY